MLAEAETKGQDGSLTFEDLKSINAFAWFLNEKDSLTLSKLQTKVTAKIELKRKHNGDDEMDPKAADEDAAASGFDYDIFG
eukprot:7956781-Lingulodinium_polyedra.AAC.1